MRLLLAAALAAAVVAGAGAIRAHYVAQGDAQGALRVQSKWDAQKLVDQAESLRLVRLANADQLVKFRNSERNAHEQATRQAATARRAAATAAADGRMQLAIETLNQRDRAAAEGDTGAAALVVKATVARELLGSCTAAYREVAAEAAGLRDQVVGLLNDANHVCRPTEGTP